LDAGALVEPPTIKTTIPMITTDTYAMHLYFGHNYRKNQTSATFACKKIRPPRYQGP